MSITVAQGAVASTISSTSESRLSGETAVSSDGAFDGLSGDGVSDGRVRHLLFGTLVDVKGAIAHLHALGYAEPNDWSRPISTSRPNEVMTILTKRVRRRD